MIRLVLAVGALAIATIAVVPFGCSPCGGEFVGQSEPASCSSAKETTYPDASGDSPAATVTYNPPPPPPPSPTVQSPQLVACGPPTDAGLPEGSCNAMGCGPAVDEQYVFGDMPAPIGGGIPPGTYALSALDNYGSGKTGPTGYVLQESFQYEGTTWDKVTTSGTLDAGLGPVGRGSGTYSTSGTSITWTETCGTGGFTVGYSFTNGTFRTFFGAREYIYSLQQ